MPFALTFVGLILVITGFQDTYKQFGSQVQKDFTGPGNFIYWIIALMIVGGIGYIKSLEGLSRAFMVLIILALVIATYKKNPNFFSSFNSQVSSGSTAQVDAVGTPIAGGGGSTASSSGGFNLSNLGQDVSLAETAAQFL